MEVVDPGRRPPKNAYRALIVTRNERRRIQDRDLAVPWESWQAEVSDIVAQQDEAAEALRAREDERARADADRTRLDPDRELPATYEDAVPWSAKHNESRDRSALAVEFIASLETQRNIEQNTVSAIFADLPAPLVRDVVSAGWRDTGHEGTVRRTFSRAALMLRHAFDATFDEQPYVDRHVTQPHRVLKAHDLAFVEAVEVAFGTDGGELCLPPVPPLPDWVDEDNRRLATKLGWLRVAVVDTSGNHLHEPGCPSFRSQAQPLDGAEHRAWWEVLLERRSRLCGRYDGPALRDLSPVMGFIAASDVWHDRGGGGLESWQRRAVQHLIAASAEARAGTTEPDVTLQRDS